MRHEAGVLAAALVVLSGFAAAADLVCTGKDCVREKTVKVQESYNYSSIVQRIEWLDQSIADDTEERQRDYDRKTEDITQKQEEKARLEAIKEDMISAGVDVAQAQAQAQVEQENVTATVGADE